MAVDAAMRKLQVPPRFIPYLEKHRIYELFHELGNELAMFQPEDPLVFLNQCLSRLGKGRDRRLIILMTSPYLDTIKLAHLLSVKTGCGIISRYIACLKPGDFFDPDSLAENTANIIRDSDKDGWILADYPTNVKEAKALIKSGVIPTHAFLVLPDDQENPALSYYAEGGQDHKDNDKLQSVSTTPSILLEFENSLHRLNELFCSSLKTIKTNGMDLEEIANACARLTLKPPPRHAPKLFRVVLIGPRGSRRRTVAKILNKKYNLVHVDMESLIKVGRMMENELGDKIRWLDDNNSLYPTGIIFELLKSRLYKPDCLERGYVLTNFPTCLTDFVLLDSIETPPNRVIFMDIESDECQERLEDRVVNEHSGRLYSKKTVAKNQLLKSQTHTHPDDDACTVTEEIIFYNKRKKALMEYCGKSSWRVDARGPITALVERVEDVLMSSSPVAQPRPEKIITKNSLKNYLLTDTSKASHETLKSRMSYPISRIDIVPLIDSETLMKRYSELRKSPQDQRSDVIPSKISTNQSHLYENKEPVSIAPEEAAKLSMKSNDQFGNNFQGTEIRTIMPPNTDESIHSVSSTEVGRVFS